MQESKTTVLMDSMNLDNDNTKALDKVAYATLLCIDDSMLPEEHKGLTVYLIDSPQIVGRHPDCDIYVPFAKISRQHAKFYSEDDLWYVEDLKSSNGVKVNNERVSKQVLKSGDEVIIGSVPFLFKQKKKPQAEKPLSSVKVSDETVMMDPDEMDPQIFQAEQASASPSGQKNTSGNETIMFNQVEAASLLINAQADKNNLVEEIEKDRLSRDDDKTTLNTRIRPVKKKTPKGLFAAIGVLLLIMMAGGFFAYYTSQKEQSTIAKNQKAVKHFIYNYEARISSDADEAAELEILRDIAAGISVSRNLYPDAEVLHMLQAKVNFLIFERKFAQLVRNNKMDKTPELANETKEEIVRLKGRTAEKSKNRKVISETAELFTLVDIIIKYKVFQQQFGEPGRGQSYRPGRFQLQELKREKQRFVKLEKQKNSILSTSYPYFKRLIREQYNDFELIYEWERIYKDNP